MQSLVRSRPLQIAAAATLVGTAATGFVPLFAGPGYESALAAGLILPSLAAVATAVEVSDHPPLPSRAFVRGLETGALLVGIGYAVTLLHGLRTGMCDARSGTAMWALGPLPGALLGGAWGALVGGLMGRIRALWTSRIVAAIAALAAPAACVLVSLYRFHSSPIVFAFDPFFGFFSGALYDTVVTDAIPRLVTYRAGTLATLFAAGAAASLVVRKGDGTLSLVRQRHPGVMWLAVVGALASIVMTVEGRRFGHWQTAESIHTELGGRVTNDRCDVFYPRSMRDEDAQTLLRDCAAQAREVASYYELDKPPQVKVYAFASRRQKRELMGAGRTSIAKPWRHEVYIQLAGYPHGVLGHEIAHVLAGTFGNGPFAIAGSFGGLWPNPGLIEGIAEAASPDDDLLTAQQWSAAMLKLELLPPLSKVFAFGFFGENAPKAYTVAGAFVGWLRERHSATAIRKWYAGTTIEKATGRSLAELEQEWLASLRGIPVEGPALAYAKSRFDRPAVFGRRCPHAVDALVERGSELVGEGDCIGAAMSFGQASLLDPNDTHARLGLSGCLPRLVGPDAARQQWAPVANDPKVSQDARDRALEAMADIDLVNGQLARAGDAYDQLLTTTFHEDRLRSLAIKALAAREPRIGRAVGEMLVGAVSRPSNTKLAYSLLGQWMAEVSDDGLPAYLIGRNLANDGLWREAADYLDEALRRRLPAGRISREVLRLRIVVACAERDEETARAAFARWRADKELPESRRTALERRLGSCVR